MEEGRFIRGKKKSLSLGPQEVDPICWGEYLGNVTYATPW